MAETEEVDEKEGEPYKAFETEQNFKDFQSKTFSSGYNEHQTKTLSRLGEAIGEEIADLDTAISKVSEFKQKVSEGIDDPTATPEYKQLSGKYDALKTERDNAVQQSQQVTQQYDIDKAYNRGLVKLKDTHKFETIGEPEVRTLFDAQHKVEKSGDKLVVKRKNEELGEMVTVTGDSGDPKPVSEVVSEFAAKYATPKAEGAGGGTGGGQGTGKPKRSAFRAAVNSGDDETADKLFAQSQEAGGFIEDVDEAT